MVGPFAKREGLGMWGEIAAIVGNHPITLMVCFADHKSEEWSPWLTFPDEGYAEVAGYGPFRMIEARTVLINSVERKRVGRLVSEKLIDHSQTVCDALTAYGIIWKEHGLGVFEVTI